MMEFVLEMGIRSRFEEPWAWYKEELDKDKPFRGEEGGWGMIARHMFTYIIWAPCPAINSPLPIQYFTNIDLLSVSVGCLRC